METKKLLLPLTYYLSPDLLTNTCRKYLLASMTLYILKGYCGTLALFTLYMNSLYLSIRSVSS